MLALRTSASATAPARRASGSPSGGALAGVVRPDRDGFYRIRVVSQPPTSQASAKRDLPPWLEKTFGDAAWHRDRFAGDRQAGGRSKQAPSGSQAHQNRRVGGGRVGVLGCGARLQRAAGSRCDSAGRGFHRTTAAGSASSATAAR